MLHVYKFESGQKGEKVLVLGAIHGNEVAGPIACEKLMEKLNSGEIKLLKGSLSLVSVANPKAHEKDVRQIEENLNRVINFWEKPDTYEKKLGVEVATLIDSHDYMLDIHSTHNAGDVPFSFLDYPSEGNMKLVDAMEVDFVISGWPDVYGSQEEIIDFSTEKFAHVVNKYGVTLEAGYHKDPKAIDLAYNSILNFLKNLKMIEGGFHKRDKKIVKMTQIVIKEKEGKLVEDFKHLDFISKGTLIAQCDDGENFYAQEDCYMIIPNHKAEIGAEWYYLGV